MKPGTFTQLYIQLVFSPFHREFLLNSEIRPQLFSYMCGILAHLKHKSIIINGVEDHVHLFLGLNPDISVSDTVRELKRSSSLFINQSKYFVGKFEWQSGYGGFSYSHSQIGKVYNYILNQESPSQKKKFQGRIPGFFK